MKQALLITAYKNFNHLHDLSSFFDDDFELYIHIDKKSVVPEGVLNSIRERTNVKLVSREYKVNWGGLNHLRCILHLAEEAYKNPAIDYFHLISGHDFPIKSLPEIKAFVFNNKQHSFISHFKLPSVHWFDGGLSRLKYYNFYDVLDGKRHRNYIFKLVALQKKLGIKRRLSSKLPKLYGGETWWSLSREALGYVLDYTVQHPELLNRMKHTFCSEEMYVQTVLLNSPLKSTIVSKSLSFIDWTNKHGNFPANLVLEDQSRLLESDKLFARKFEYPQSEPLKTALLKTFASNG